MFVDVSALEMEIALFVFCVAFYFIQNMKNARIRKIVVCVVLLLHFMIISFAYENSVSCIGEKKAFQRVCDCIQIGVPKEKIQERLEYCINNHNPDESQLVFALRVRMAMSRLYYEQDEKNAEASSPQVEAECELNEMEVKSNEPK